FASMSYIGKSLPDSKRGFRFGRIIQGLDSNCRLILQRWNNKGFVTDFLLFTFLPLQFALVPPAYVSIVLNPSNEMTTRFFTLDAKEEKTDIETIDQLGGPGYLLKKDGKLVPNINYAELSIPRIHPALDQHKFLQRSPLYTMFTKSSKSFDFIDPPREDFFAGSL
ncbi:MAG: hypothetical protein IH840_09935, partial [Candidatus Heimdallarchaeota archaeon]|nr:hypothetical protein [Candidatus Heimdallarchaeota archaeon]